MQTHAGGVLLKTALMSVLAVALEPGCVSAFQPALCSPHAANHGYQRCLALSLPWNPFPCGKIELQVGPAEGEEKSVG